VVLPVVALGFLGYRVSGIGYRVSGIGYRVSDIGYRVSGIGYRVSGIGYALLWGGGFALTIVLVWPAVWADPLRVYELLRFGVAGEGAQPHMTGNFFLGQPVETPDLRFYPLALALRTTPLTLAGLLLLPLAWWYIRRQGDTRARHSLLLLVVFVLLFVLAMSLFPKKLNRYLVPVFPALDILAAAGLVWGAAALAQWARRRERVVANVTNAVVIAAALLALLNVAWWHPYSIAAFNQALGGTPAGARSFALGWGEGLGQVADWLNQQPDITGVVTASILTPNLNPYLRHGAQATTPTGDTLPPQTGYVVVYVSQMQGQVFAPFDQFYPEQTPLHTVTIHGVDYAHIYQVPPPVAQARAADFGTVLHLRGYEQEAAARPGGELVLKLFWQTHERPAVDYWLFAHLIDQEGRRVAQVDLPYPTASWGARRFVTSELRMGLPADLPAGRYTLLLGLYNPATGERLPLDAAPGALADPARSGPHALRLTEVVLE
jgi:hypothetical protein